MYSIFWRNKLQDTFLNLYIIIKIAFSVRSVSTEHSFSKLKIIKNRLRSIMTGERLENLMKISYETDIDINYNKVLEIFPSKMLHC